MVLIKNRIEKMIRIIKCYPIDTIEFVLLKVSSEMSRTDSREYNSCKTIDKKLEFVLKREIHWAKFFVELYSTAYGDCPKCGYETVSEISDRCDAENYLERIAYFLLCCSNDIKYFERNISLFLSSEVVEKTLNNLWVIPMSIASDHTKSDTIESDRNTMSEDTMMNTYYIGYIKNQNNYFNFYPIAKLHGGELESISTDMLVSLFPRYGGINLRTESKHNNSYAYLSNLEGIIDSYLGYSQPKTKLFAVKFSEEDLTDSDDDKIILKLEIDAIVRRGISINNIICEASELGIYRVVSSEYNSPSFVEGSINVYSDNSSLFVGEKVLLSCDQRLYGPYEVQINRNSEMTISPNVRASMFVADYWDNIDLQEVDSSIRIFGIDFSEHIFLVQPSEKKQEDFITKSDIIDSVAKIIVDSDNDSKKFMRMLSTECPLLASTLPVEVINHRTGLALELFEVEDSRKKILERFSAAVTQSDIAEVFKGRVVPRDEFNESQTEKDNYSKTIESLKKELAEKTACISKYEQEQLESNISSVSEQVYQQLKEENERLKDENTRINAENLTIHEQLSRHDNLENEIRDLVTIKNVREKDAKEAEDKKKKTFDEIDSKMKEITEKMSEQVSAAFDPMISNKLLEAASRYDSDNEQLELDEKVNSTKSIDGSEIIFHGDDEELLNYIVSNIKKYRNYSFNQIVNILICLTQNFLTVFSGEPGIGKTSICNIIANSLGLNLFEEYSAPNRYVTVSVEKGWATKRDLIGYYNPLTHKYDKSNSNVYNGLMLLDKEAEGSAYPFFILLDEANLSQMEYYWADFMNIADEQSALCKINIGIEKELVIPHTLRFMATINNDETTVDLSPRLIDRAWVIHLPDNPKFVPNPPSNYKLVFNKIISWKSLCDIFVPKPDQLIDDDSDDLLNSVYKVFEKYRYTISPRIKKAIERYIIIANSIMEDEPGVSKSKIAIDYAVLQKLLPKIRGVYDDRIENLLVELKDFSDRYNLKLTKRVIEDAMYRHQHEMDMGFCSFMN